MLNSVDFSGRPFHFIGIGGIGMSALAYVLAKRKLPVSGSDIRLTHITQRLQEQGAHIFWSQDAANLEFFHPITNLTADILPTAICSTAKTSSPESISASLSKGSLLAEQQKSVTLPQVVCSTAINPENSEYRAALDLGCPIFHRSDILAALIQQHQSIAVAGTHGKTTTSSLIGYMLLQAGLDPTVVVGGEVNAWQGNARVGESPYLVAEADESDGSLVKFAAEVGVVTNIELDHPDHYSNLDEVIATFKTFAQRCRTLVGCIDCATVKEALQPMISYSLNPDVGADYAVDQVTYSFNGTTACVLERGQVLGQLKVQLLGRHNLSNSLAAVAVGRLLGLDFGAIASAIATFEGARRRFEYRGEYNSILFVDDYAHHPSEIQATLAAARLQANGSSTSSPRRVVAVFQPHRYSRTLTFLEGFSQSFTDADLVVVTDIYSAGEPDSGEINGQKLAEAIAAHHPQVKYQSSLQVVYESLTEVLVPGDLVLFLGAGNLNQIIPDLMTYYQRMDQGISSEWCSQA